MTAIALAGCATDADPHKVGPCDEAAWAAFGANPPPTKCEAACEMPPNYTEPGCSIKYPDGAIGNAAASVTIDGERGFCIPDATATKMLFAKCL